METGNRLSDSENVGGLLNEPLKNSDEQAKTSSTGEGDASFGKFENLEELLKAYNNLEVQFTKRSQELKRLERENNSLREEQARMVEHENDSDNCAKSHAIQDETGSVAKERTEQQASLEELSEDEKISAEVATFLKAHPEARHYAEAIAQKTCELGEIGKGFLERAYIEVLRDAISDERAKINEDFIYKSVNDLPAVREKLIRDYLNEVSVGTSAKLISERGKSVVMPPKKPASLVEAGMMAEKILRKK